MSPNPRKSGDKMHKSNDVVKGAEKTPAAKTGKDITPLAKDTEGTLEGKKSNDKKTTGPSSMETILNNPTKALGKLRKTIEGAFKPSDVKVEIDDAKVKPLLTKSAKERTEKENDLVAKYYIQKAEKLAEKAEANGDGSTEALIGSIMYRVRALMLQMKDIFNFNEPVINNETPEELEKLPTEGEDFTNTHAEKVQDTEKIAQSIEQNHNIPAAAIVAIASIEGDFFLEESARSKANTFGTKDDKGELVKYENMKACFDDFGKRTSALMEGANISSDEPVKYLTEYLKRKYKAEGKSEEASKEAVKDYLQRANAKMANLYEKDQLSNEVYHLWSEDIKNNLGDLEKTYGIEEKTVRTAPLRNKEVVFNGEISPQLSKKLGENSEFFMKSCKYFGVKPSMAGAFMRIECGFNYKAINKQTKAQGAAQMMPKYVTHFFQKFRQHMDKIPELQHARGKGTKLIFRSEAVKNGYTIIENMNTKGSIVRVPVLPHEYDVFDPKVGVFIVAAFVAQHTRHLQRNSNKITKIFGKPYAQLDQTTKDALMYMPHNPGPNGMWKVLRENGLTRESKIVANYARKFRQTG